MVRELAVGLEVGAHLLDRELVQQRPDHRPGHAVAAVEHHLQRADLVGLDELQRVLPERVADVLARDLARLLGGQARARRP